MRGCEGRLRSRPSAKLLSIGRRRRRELTLIADGRRERQQASQYVSQRQGSSLFEPTDSSGTKNVTDKNSLLARLPILILAILSLSIRAFAMTTTQPSTADARVDGLISQLASDDADQRQAAATALEQIGLEARPAVLKAVHSDDPTLRGEAGQVLLNLPWFVPSDSDDVRQNLLHYGDPEVSARREIVNRLAALDNDSGMAALERLLNEDPSLDVRWTIVARLREMDQGPQLQPYRDLTPPADDPAMLALCGYALEDTDFKKSLADFQAAADLEFASPSDDDGEMGRIVGILVDDAVQQKQYDRAADLRRKELARGSQPDESNVPTALLELFALHSDFGPLKGFDADVKSAGDAMSSPKILFALARMDARNGQQAKADSERAAAEAAITNRRQRFHVADFMLDHGWDDDAKAQFEKYLSTHADPFEPGDDEAIEPNAHFRLAVIAVRHNDDEQAAEQTEAAMRLLGDNASVESIDGRGHHWIISANDEWAEVHWHYLKAALARNDQAAAKSHLDQLAQLKPTDPDIVIDVYPSLKQMGHADEAQAMFDGALEQTRRRLAADPHNASLLNEAAWLCAECYQNLPEAKRWADEAMAILPNDAAVIDTAAEVNFDLGDAAEAVRLETRALQLQPGDEFMEGQLKRFAAPATRP
jgi:tetratricopeptide (TPR) repeat protein